LTDKLVMSAVRGLAGQFRGYSSNTERGALLLAQSELNQGGGLVIRDGETVDLAVSRRLIAAAPSTTLSLGPYAGIGEAFAGGRAATPEEVKQAQAIIERKITRSEVAQQAIGILEGTIDPIKPNKKQGTGLLAATGAFAQRTSIDVGTSFGAMAPMMLPMAGVMIAQGGYADDEYEKLREEGNSPAAAHMASQLTGALQAGFERAAFLFNFVPSSTIARMTAVKAGSKLMGLRPALETSTTFRILSKMGTIQAAEYGEEVAQAAAPILTGFLGEHLGWNMAEQSKFLGEWQQFKEEGGFWRPEVFATVMVLAVGGGGYQGLSNSVQAKAAMQTMLGDQTMLEAMGIAPAKAAEIVAMPETERQAAYQAAYPERNPSAPEAVAAQKLVTAQVDAQKAKGAAEVQAMESEGLSITRTADGYAVTDLTEPDTAPIPHATAEEAMTTVRGIVKARGMKRQDSFLDALDEYVSFMESGRTIQLSNKSTNLLKELETAVTQDNKQWVEDIWDRADQERSKVGLDVLERDLSNPDSAAALFGMKVLGRSKSEAKGNVAKAISYVMAGGQTLDLVEEQAENDMGDALAAGETTTETVEAILRRIETFTGDKYIYSNTTQGIKEAWAAVVRLYTTGTRKGNKITKGARQETAAALRIERQRLRSAETAGVTPSAFAKMREYLDYLKGIMGQVYRLQKARDAGLLDDLEAMIRESVGLKEQDALEAKVAESVPTTYNLETGQGTSTFGYSVRAMPYTDETPPPANIIEAIQFLVDIRSGPQTDEIKRAAEQNIATLLRDDPTQYQLVRSGNSKVFLDKRTGEYVKLSVWPTQESEAGLRKQLDFLNSYGSRFAALPKVTEVMTGTNPILILRQRPVGVEGASISRSKDITKEDLALFKELQEQNPLSSEKDINEWLRVETDISLKNMGLVLGKDGMVRAYAFDFDGIDADATLTDREKAQRRLESTPDMAGVPLSKFSPEIQQAITYTEQGTGYSISTKRDADYMAAVESGDVATQQAMVDEAAKAAGYNVGPVYHKTKDTEFTEFDLSKSSPGAVWGPAIYATMDGTWNPAHLKDARTIKGYVGGEVIDLSAPTPSDLQTLGDLVGRKLESIPLISLEKRHGSVAAGLKAAGYSAAIHQGPGSTGQHIAVFDPNQVKSADPITYDESGNVIPLSQRFNPESANIGYSIKSIAYLKDDTRFEKLKEEGRVETGVSINDFIGKHLMMHAPDNAFTGTITLNNGKLIVGKGGAYYPSLFANQNYFWASTKATAEKTANHLNLMAEKNGGKIYMALVSSPVEKLFSSTTMATGAVHWFESLSEDKAASLSKKDLNTMLGAASELAEDKDRKFSTRLNASTLAKNLKNLESFLDPTTSTFGLRKSFVEELAKQVETYYKDKPKAAAHVAQILADAQNKHAGTKLQKGQIAWNPILQGIGNALTEPFLRTFQEHGNGRVYTIIEVDGPVEAIASTEHESYPFAIVPVDRKSKVKLSILDEAMDWQDIIGDSVTGQYTPAAERKNYMPTGGMSVTRLKVLGPRPGTVANQIGYSIAPARKTSLEMQMTRDEILDAIEKSKDWKDFYTTYQYLLDEYFGDDATAFQSILSITSQAASVKANVAIALRMYGYWKRGEEFDGKKRGEAESGALSGVLRNLERWRDDVALSGRKISNYQAANEGKEGATEKVVVDRHIANMLFGTKTPTGAQFTEAEKVLTEIAQSIGWEPRQVQAALWAASIRKSGTEPASYDQYLKTLRERGTIYERTGATPGAGGIFAEGVERPIRRPVARRGAGKTGTDGYSITTAAGLENIKAQLDKVAIDPDVRFNMMQRASENLAKMVRDIGFRDDVASAANDAGMALMEQQQATALAGVVDRYSAEEQQRLRADEEALKELKAKHETALQDLSVKADIEAGGAQADGWTADQKDALKVRQRLEQTTLQARQRAETLALETKQQKATDAAKAKERQEVNLLKQEQAAQRKANEQKTGDREQRATMLDYLAALDTILMPFPAEVRNKVGGFVSLAGLRTNAAMNKYLKDRVEKLNKVLETYMRKEYTIAMERLLKKAEPTKGKPGEKMAGKLGPDVQHLMDMVRTSLKWTAEEVNAHIAGLQTTIDGGTLTAEQEVLALREIELVQLAGDWTHADAAKRSAAVQAATETYEGGYLAWKAKLIAKREAREKIKTALITDTGKAGTQTERDERAKKDLGWMGKAKDFWLSLSSFEELTRYVFGEKSEAATEMVDRERAAAYQYEDATTAMGDLVQQHFNDLAGGHLKGEQLRFRLSQKTINTPSASLSELEAIQAILLWNQEDGKRHMIGTLDENNKPTGAWHYNQDWVDSVMAQMTPEGKATMAFIQRIYAEEWATLNPLYRERHGVNLPRHENYAPITVAPVQAKGGEMVDPVSGAAMTGSILTPGSLRTRSRRAIAEPEFRDALQTMLAHTKQMEHWKAYYDFAVDAQAILGNRDVGNAVQAAAGKEGKMVLRKWLDIFSQGGSRDAGAALAGNRLLSTMSGRAARMALVGRVGTLLIQSTQLAAASAEMPVGAYVSRLGRLLSGNLGWKNAIRSEFIQRRIQQAPPIVRQAMEGMTSDRPNVVRQAANYLGTLISGADGLFTSGTYAILLDYHMAQAAKLNITGPEAADYANRQAERITERVAQPTRMGTRSLFENTQTSPLAKLGWAFASEARQKIALAAWAARNAKADPARAARVAFLTWVVGGLMAQVIRNAWKDLKDDDDDTLFDDRNWNLKQMVASTLSGPLQGIPGLGSAFQSVISNTAGTYNQQGNLLDGFGKSVPALKGLISGESMEDAEPVEEIMKDVEAILTAAGMVNETAASATSLFHLVRDGSSVLDGLQDDAEELKAKAKAADRREAAERKKQRMEQGAQ
jgi:hypothetical protein